MKKTSWMMKLLLVLPVVLLIVLSSWIVLDQREKREGTSPAVNAGEQDSETPGSSSGALEESVLEIRQETAAETEAAGKESRAGEETSTEEGGLRLLFGGDVYLSSHVTAAYDKAGGIHGVLDEGYREEIKQADIFMVNEEFPFGERGEPVPDKQYTFRLPPERAVLMQEIGADIVSLANNHTMDYGPEALSDTFAALNQAGVRYVGAGEDLERAKKPEFMEIRGKTVGFLAASRVFPDYSWAAGNKKSGMLSAYDPKTLLESVKAARIQCDYLAVYVHWGTEKKETPEDYQHDLGRQLIDAGADLVVGSHPHVLQGIEAYNGKYIVHSLGNFVFGSTIPKTALLRVDFDGEKAALSLVPGTSGAGYTRTLTGQGKLKEFCAYMEGLSSGIEIDESGNILPLEK